MKYFNTLIYSDQPGIRIFRHILFWVTDFVNWFMVVSLNENMSAKDIYAFLFTFPIVIGVTYFIIYYLIPRFSNESDKSKLFLWIGIVLLLLGVALRQYKFYVVHPFFDMDIISPDSLWSAGRIIQETFSWMAVITMAVAIKLIKNKTELQQKNEQLMAEKKNAELSFLKAQMHPHFLFNTLNTLYSETIQKSERAEDVVLHLSNLMRFMLEECNKPMIPIEKEIIVIQDYIALEKLRHGARLNVNFAATDTRPGLKISPLIFLPFIENSFKHSLNNLRGQINIDIAIQVKVSELSLTVVNDHAQQVKKVNGHSSHTGIANVKRQLDLLYNKDYSLKIEGLSDKYCVALRIPIS